MANLHAQVSAEEQACAEQLVMWATAVAAADQVHSCSEVQQAVIGACSSIRHPWPDLADVLGGAFSEAPVDRVGSSAAFVCFPVLFFFLLFILLFFCLVVILFDLFLLFVIMQLVFSLSAASEA